jgi:hypothetical protein
MTVITADVEIEVIGTCVIYLFAITYEKLQQSDRHVRYKECQED